jgi:hypothetical protein
VAKAKNSNEEMINIKKEIVDFHGEMVLLMNYSALNYTGKLFFLMSSPWLLFFVLFSYVLIIRSPKADVE